MGCDIYTYVEKRNLKNEWDFVKDYEPFEFRNYGVFGFLADVRNYSMVTPIDEPRGVLHDMSQELTEEFESWGMNCYSHSWLSVRELVEYDYMQAVNDRRVTRQVGSNSWDGGVTGNPDEGMQMTLAAFLGSEFMVDVRILERMSEDNLDSVRVVFWFG